MERNLKPTGLVNLLFALAAAGVGTFIARATASYTDEVVGVFLGLGFLVALFSYFQMRMEAREKLEKLELDELAKSARNTALFEATDAEAFPARRAREQFERWLVPAFCIVLLVLQAAAAWWLGKQVLNPEAREVRASLPMMAAFFGFLFFLQFLPGRYSVNVARLEGQRLLQPAGSYLLLGAYLCLLAAAGNVAIHFGHSKADLFMARALCVILTLAAVENLFALILEIYRPRVRGQAARVLYESRLVGLLGQPESVFTTAAHALDYQFGFKVSETWFFQFLQKAFLWLLLIQAGLLWLSTSFVFIEPEEQAILERCGKPAEGRPVLDPGFHVKFPWPIDSVYRFQTHRVQTFTVGVVTKEDDHGAAPESTIVWTKSHYKEEFNLPVANKEQDSASNTNAAGEKSAPPANLVTASVPVQYQIKDIVAWARNHANPNELLERLATREVVRHLVSVDFFDFMSVGRQKSADSLRANIQKAADQEQLGAEILFVGLQDVHPPVSVAEAFEAVIGAEQTRAAKILTAEGEAARMSAMAAGEAQKVQDTARSFEVRRVAEAGAIAGQFQHQMAAFEAAPTVYPQRLYLQTFAKAIAKSRKYIIATTNAQEMIQLNLEDKIREDLLNLEIPAKK
ncbi:MAG: protease modulator HflK [Verrucomicrobia bacterium]|nr:protease modulator HflK [Verrucomicrobiota bacterium]